MKRKFMSIASLLLAITMLISSCGTEPANINSHSDYIASVNEVPAFSNTPYVAIKGNVPDFTSADMVTESYEHYSELDILGRCGVVMACIGTDIMPTEERESIGSVKPSGWQTVKYDIVDGKYLYNRCHLIGFQLTGENANKQNLITGTRYMNVEGMLPFENMVADYVKETENHVIYRVTPIFDGLNLVARGVQMEAKSVEDDGEGICFNVYVYNNQPGITINYLNGDSALSENYVLVSSDTSNEAQTAEERDYVINKNTDKFHYPECDSAKDIQEHNREERRATREDLIYEGYTPCGKCKP